MANDLVQARACYDRGAWDEAFEGLRLADQAAPLSCADLQRLGFAAYLIGGEVESSSGASTASIARRWTKGSASRLRAPRSGSA